jgi:regulator of protease activity HflC (stomatin/prohibitin superfamily)
MEAFGWLLALVLGGAGLASSVKVVNQGNEALVERVGKYSGKKLEPGINFSPLVTVNSTLSPRQNRGDTGCE